MTDAVDNRRKKLLYRASYRGFKEADLLIGGFARAHLGAMSDDDLDEFEALLTLNDRDLYAWATGKKDPPRSVEGVVFNRLCAFKLNVD